MLNPRFYGGGFLLNNLRRQKMKREVLISLFFVPIKMYLRGKRYENEKKMITEFRGNQYKESGHGQNDHKQKEPKFDYPNNTTARKIADEYGVGPSTIQ
jgi:hypothetical protein